MSQGSSNRRIVALLIGSFCCGPAAGVYYMGHARRSWLWALGPLVATIALGAALGPLGASLSFKAIVAAFVVVGLVSFIGPFIDILVSGEERAPSFGNLVVHCGIVGFLSAIVATFTAFRVRADLGEAFKIPAGSMIPTLLPGDHIFVDKRKRVIARGDVIVFGFPENPSVDYVKRVVGMPGDRIVVKGGVPWINGVEAPHCSAGRTRYTEPDTGDVHRGELLVEYLDGKAHLLFVDEATRGAPGEQGPFTVAPNEYFVLGDNRNNSHDSRSWFGEKGGGVPISLVRGNAGFVWLNTSMAGRAGTGLDGVVLPPDMASLQAGVDACLAVGPKASGVR